MKNNKLIYFAILLISLLAISGVSASEIDGNFDISNDNLAVDDSEIDDDLESPDFQLENNEDDSSNLNLEDTVDSTLYEFEKSKDNVLDSNNLSAADDYKILVNGKTYNRIEGYENQTIHLEIVITNNDQVVQTNGYLELQYPSSSGGNIHAKPDVVKGVASLDIKLPEIENADQRSFTNTIYYYTGSYNTLTAVGSFTLVVKKFVNKIQLNLTPEDGSVGSNSHFVVTVRDLLNNYINTGMTKFYVDNVLVGNSTVSRGFSTFDYIPLTAGKHKVKVLYTGNYNFNDTNITTNWNVQKDGSILTLDDVSTNVGSNVILSALVNSLSGVLVNDGNVNFYVNGELIGTAPVIDGVATISFTPTVGGEKQLSAVFTSSNFLDSSNTSSLAVNKANIILSIENVEDALFTESSKFIVNVLSNLNEVNEGIVKFYINNTEIGSANVFEGKSTFEYMYPNVGTFELNAIFEESDNYLSNTTSASFTINKMPTFIECESKIFKDDEDIFSIKLLDKNGSGISNETVNLILSKSTGELKFLKSISDSNGIVDYSISDLTGGLWSVSCNFEGSENYAASSDSNKFIVTKSETVLIFKEINDAYVNNQIQLSADVYDKIGNLINVGVAHLLINDMEIGVLNFDNHTVTNYLTNKTTEFNLNSKLFLDYMPKVKGNYSFKVIYEGTDLYKTSNQTITFYVKEVSKIFAPAITAIYQNNKYLIVTLKDSKGNILANKKVTINVGFISKTLTTNAKGQVSVLISNMVPKTYNAAISFAGDSDNMKSSASAKVVVKKATPKLTAKAKTFRVKVKTKKYTITLKSNNGKVMKNTKVTLTVNKKTYSVKTNSKGVATFKITNLKKKGKFTAVVKYAGSKYYNKVTKKPKITIKA